MSRPAGSNEVQFAQIQRRFVTIRGRNIHVAMSGSGNAPALLLLHQTPRSWDEFRDCLPRLGNDRRVIAMDTLGFGDSDPAPQGEASIETWAEFALGLMDELGHESFCVVGHHTGAVIAVEMAARAPERIAALVLSSCPFIDAAKRESALRKPTIDTVESRPGGGHLVDLWAQRQPYYPIDDTDLLQRLVMDAIKAGPMAVEGHYVVNRYRMEDRIGLVSAPTLVIDAALDPFAHSSARLVQEAIAGSRLATISNGMIPLPDQLPDAFSQTVLSFLGEQMSS
jgi:pimeloyl-ACP methyl ester carboxylesterase